MAPLFGRDVKVLGGRQKSTEGDKQNMWTQLLDSVATGKKLPEKTLLVLGGTAESQREFVESLEHDPANKRRPQDRDRSRKPPIANKYALGYTYQDALDVDQDDILARISIYFLADSSPAFVPLLRPLMTTKTIRGMLIVILLDWGQPWLWARQLRQWIRNIRSLVVSLDDDCKDVMEENIIDWRQRRRDAAEEGSMSSAVEVPMTLGPGEWDEPLGIPLCVVCQHAEKTEILERERAWKEEQFDFIMQFMRTVLLKHGASLIYTASSSPGFLRPLIHSSLAITSLLQKTSIKHNVIDRDKVLVPPNWDSWGKIRPVRENFDVESVSNAWSVDIQPQPQNFITGTGTQAYASDNEIAQTSAQNEDAAAVSLYENRVEDPDRYDALSARSKQTPKIEVEAMDNQQFLATQFAVVERLRAEEQEKRALEAKKQAATSYFAESNGTNDNNNDPGSRFTDKIGPLQFNMGGINVDADDALRRLRDREADRTRGEDTPSPAPTPTMKNGELADFFAGLVKRGGRSTPGTPK